MLVKPFAVVAAGLSAATAFLVTPDMIPTETDSVTAPPFTVPSIAQSQSLNLDCPGCPVRFTNRHGKLRIKQGVPNHLELDFTIDHQPENDRLLVNGFELYPSSSILSNTLTAAQVAVCKKTQKSRRLPEPVDLGFGLQWGTVAKDDDAQMTIVNLDLQIIEVNNVFVDGISNVEIKLIKTADGGLMIANIGMTESQTSPAKADDDKAECKTIICKWKKVIAQQMARMKGHKCSKMGKMGHHKGHHHAHHHHSGRPGQLELHEHSWKQLIKSFGSHILFPILVGIAAGVSVSIIGMMIGTLIVGLWRVLVRRQSFFPHRRRHSGHAHKAAQREAVVAEEKAGLMAADQEELPAYKDNVEQE